MTIAFDPTLLLAATDARWGVRPSTGTAGASTTGAAASKAAPTPPWAPASSAARSTAGSGFKSSTAVSTTASIDALVDRINARGASINPADVKLSGSSTTSAAAADYQSLFAVYQTLNDLKALATAASQASTSSAERTRIQAAYDKSNQAVSTFLEAHKFSAFKLLDGQAASSDVAKAIEPGETDAYVTRSLHSGALTDPISGLSGRVAFQLTISSATQPTRTLSFDLADLGDQPRTLANVVSYLNGKLKAGGYSTRFAVAQTPDKTAAAGAPRQLLSLQINGASYEHLSFSDPAASPAVYVAQSAGYAAPPAGSAPSTPPQQQLVKLDPAATGASTTFTRALDTTQVDALARGADGSLFAVTTDRTKAPDGQPVVGAQDLTLSKCDSAGNLVFSRTLGAKGAATGYALAVSADGKQVAVAGSITGALDAVSPGSTQSGSDTVVSVFSAGQGDEVWTRRLGAPAGDDHPTAVAIGSDGSVYVTGQTSSPLNGASGQVSGSDNFLISLSSTGATRFSTQYGSAGSNHASGAVAVGDQVIVAGVENGHAVLRSFKAAGPASQTAVRDLGDLQGGDIAGIGLGQDGGLILAGSTHNGALGVARTTAASSGGRDVFVADLSSSLAPKGSDTIAYAAVGGSAATTSLSVLGSKVYVAGQNTAAGSTAPSGYVVAIDPTAGAVGPVHNLTGLDGQDAVKAVVATATGTSSLDKLGLPSGAIDWTRSGLLIDNTSLRPGDSFLVNVGGTRSPVTITASDTLATLAAKINRASGYAATASSVYIGSGHQLRIAPTTGSSSFGIEPGPAGADALPGLGLSAAVISGGSSALSTALSPRNSLKSAPYTLNLAATADLTSASGAKLAESNVSSAITTLKAVYSDLTTPRAAASSGAAPNRPAPAYLTRELAGYRAGLARLQSGS